MNWASLTIFVQTNDNFSCHFSVKIFSTKRWSWKRGGSSLYTLCLVNFVMLLFWTLLSILFYPFSQASDVKTTVRAQLSFSKCQVASLFIKRHDLFSYCYQFLITFLITYTPSVFRVEFLLTSEEIVCCEIAVKIYNCATFERRWVMFSSILCLLSDCSAVFFSFFLLFELISHLFLSHVSVQNPCLSGEWSSADLWPLSRDRSRNWFIHSCVKYRPSLKLVCSDWEIRSAVGIDTQLR